MFNLTQPPYKEHEGYPIYIVSINVFYIFPVFIDV